MAEGGKIHIKPSHRGRLTELKERTGKTEAELYNDGNPAHKRMVVFDRNARKWKHGDGGFINTFGPGGYLTDEDIQEGTDERSQYARQIIRYATNNPKPFWSDTSEASAARMWLNNNAPDQLASLYNGLDDEFKKGVDRRFVPEKSKSYEFEEGIRDYRDNEGVKFTLGAASVPLTTMGVTEAALAAPGAVSWLADAGNIGKLVRAAGDIGLTELIDRSPRLFMDEGDRIFNDGRISSFAGKGLEWLYRKAMPESRFTESTAPWVNRIGKFASFVPEGILADKLFMGGTNLINDIYIASNSEERAISEALKKKIIIDDPKNPTTGMSYQHGSSPTYWKYADGKWELDVEKTFAENVDISEHAKKVVEKIEKDWEGQANKWKAEQEFNQSLWEAEKVKEAEAARRSLRGMPGNDDPQGQVDFILDQVKSHKRPPLRTKVTDMFGREVDIPERFAAAMEAPYFKEIYPDGVDFWWRGFHTSRLPDSVKWYDMLQDYNRRYAGVFGGEYDMAFDYIEGFGHQSPGAQAVLSTEGAAKPNMWLMMTPRGGFYDLGPFEGASWHDLPDLASKEAMDAQRALTDMYAKIKADPNYVMDPVLKSYYEDTISAHPLSIPELTSNPIVNTDELATYMRNIPVTRITLFPYPGVHLHDIQDGFRGSEVIWVPERGGFPKAVTPYSTLKFDLKDPSLLKDGGPVKKFDGNTEPTGQMDRKPNWKVRGKDYTLWNPSNVQEIINWGVTDPASFFGDEGASTREQLNNAGMTKQVIGGIYDLLPKHQQWLYAYDYRPEEEKQAEFNKGITDYTGYVAPRLGAAMAGSLLGAAGLYWLPETAGFLKSVPGILKEMPRDIFQFAKTQAGRKAIADFAASTLGGFAVDEGVKAYTPYGSFGEGLYAPIRAASDRFDEKHGTTMPEFVHNANEFAFGFANPGYYVGGLGIPLAQNVAKGVGDAWRWGRFVTGNGNEYADALKRMQELYGRAQSSSLPGSPLRLAEGKVAANPATYEVPVDLRTVSSTMARGLDGFQTSVPFKAYEGAPTVMVPQTVEDLGLGVGRTVTYPAAASDGAGGAGTVKFYGYTGSRPYSYGDAFNVFYDAAGKARPYPYEHPYLNPREYRIGESAENFDDWMRYSESGGRGSVPIQRGGETGPEAIRKSAANTRALLGDYGYLSGSTVFYEDGALSGVPGDTEIVCCKSDVQNVANALDINDLTRINDFAYHGHSAKVPKGNQRHAVDIQVIEENADGDAVGNLAWSMYRTLHPDEYYKLVNEYAKLDVSASGKGGSDFHLFNHTVRNPETGNPYKARELFDAFREAQMPEQQVINDALSMNKNVRAGVGGHGTMEENILKHNRPLAILTNGSPRMKAMARKAIDTIARAELGPGYMHGSQFFPNIDFANVEANAQFLKDMGIKAEGIAEDPEMMRNLFDAWFLTESTMIRGVDSITNYMTLRNALFGGNYSPTGRDYSGAGLNTLRAGVDHFADNYSQRGIMQVLPSFEKIEPGIASTKDALDFAKRLNRANPLTKTQQAAVRNELDAMISDFSSRGVKDYQLDVLKDMKRGINNVQSLVRMDEYLTRFAKELPDPLRGEAIDRMARAIDIPGYGTSAYNKMYYGKLISGEPGATSIKLVDPWKMSRPANRNLFEVGRPLGSYAAPEGKGVETIGESAFNKGRDMIPDGEREFVESVLGVRHIRPEALEATGSQKIGPEGADELVGELQKLKDDAWEKKLLWERMEQMENTPLSRRAIRKAEESTGLKRGDDYFDEPVVKGEAKVEAISRDQMRGLKKAIEAYEKRGGKVEMTKSDMKDFVRQPNGKYIWSIDGGYTGYEYDPATGELSDLDLPFANGGILNRMGSVYGNDVGAMRAAIANARKKLKG